MADSDKKNPGEKPVKVKFSLKKRDSKRVIHNRFLKKVGLEDHIKVVEHYVKPIRVPKKKAVLPKKVKKVKRTVKEKPVMDDAFFQSVLLKTRTHVERQSWPKEKREKKEKVEKTLPLPYIKGKPLNATFHDLGNRGRLYAKGTFTGYRRGQRNQYENIALLTIEGSNTRSNAAFYSGKRCVFMYTCKNGSKTNRGRRTNVRVIWGKVRRPHGNRGSVRATFKTNLPARSMGNRVRIMMYPSRI